MVEIKHLPAHTPEHIGLHVTDRARSTEPWFVATVRRDIQAPRPNAAANRAANLGQQRVAA